MKHTSSGGPSAPRTTGISMIPASHGEDLHNESHHRQAGSGTEGCRITGSTTTTPTAAASATMGLPATGSSDGTTLAPTTPILWKSASNQQVVILPSKPKEKEVTFNSFTDKPVATGSQDADDHGRQHPRSQPNNTWPASHSRGGCTGSSGRTTSKQMASQGSEHPSGAPQGASAAPRLRSTLHPCASGVKAPKDPLKCLAHYQSQGWRKDLELVF